MRYLLTVILCILLLIALGLTTPVAFGKYVLDNVSGQVEVFCTQTNLPCTNVGFGKIVSCNSKNLGYVLSKCSNVQGLSVVTCGDNHVIDKLLADLDVSVSMRQQIGSDVILYGYSSKLQGYLVVDGNKVNVQVAFDGNTITVGSPLIFGSY